MRMTRKLRVCSCPSEFGKAEQSRSAFEARNTIGQLRTDRASLRFFRQIVAQPMSSRTDSESLIL
jgi:hypothetical protein